MTSNGNIFRVTGLLCGELPVTSEFPSHWPVTWSFHVFFDLCLNKQLGKQSKQRDLRRHRVHYDVIVMERKNPIVNSMWLVSSRGDIELVQHWFM